MAAVLSDDSGRVLVTQRPAAVHQGGLWEFPGGKLEPGEDRYAGLCRELHEELGIEVRDARPLLRVRHDYGDRAVLLDVLRVNAFDGDAHGREGQPLQWVEPDALPNLSMPAADVPIVNAVRLPALYAITGEYDDPTDFQRRLSSVLSQGVRLLQLRAKGADEAGLRALADQAIPRCRAAGARLLLNGSPDLARALDTDGVHLDTSRLLALRERPLPADRWVGASCHNLAELQHAAAIGADFAVLSPVLPTASHPDAEPLGWPRVVNWLEEVNLPTYVLGGVGPEHLGQAWASGAQGVAAVRAFWHTAS